MRIERKLMDLGLSLPPAPIIPPGMRIPFAWVRVRGNRAYISGQGPQQPDGRLGPFGQVGTDLTVDEGYEAARLTALAILGSLDREIGDLNRVSAWLMVSGMVNAVPGLTETTRVINGFSELILELYGDEIGMHARTAIGVSALPLNLPVIISAEVELA